MVRRSISAAAACHNPPGPDFPRLSKSPAYGGMPQPIGEAAVTKVPLALLFVLALSGCAARSVPWENPDLPKEQWSRDWSSCRRWAEAQVGYQEGASAAQFSDYDRARAKRQADALSGACMRERGYFPARKK